MHPPISRHQLACILAEADVASRRLHRRLCLPAADLDDLRQDLLIDLIRRLSAFDASRGSIGAFAGIVLRNQASRIALRHHRDRCSRGGALVSLDAPFGPDTTDTFGDTLSQSDGLAAWHGQGCDDLARTVLRHDLARVLGHQNRVHRPGTPRGTYDPHPACARPSPKPGETPPTARRCQSRPTDPSWRRGSRNGPKDRKNPSAPSLHPQCRITVSPHRNAGGGVVYRGVPR